MFKTLGHTMLFQTLCRRYAELSHLKQSLLIAVAVMLLLGLAFILSSRFNPAPPRAITFSAGSAGGAYDAFAKGYATELAKQGVKVTVLPSAGSLENLSHLTAAEPKADVALVQSGVATPAQLLSLQGITAVAYEPVWIFTKASAPAPNTLAQLAKLNLALPKLGSGARVTVEHLFQAASLELNPNWQDYSPADAADALDAGKVQAIVMVAGIQAPIVQRLLNSPHGLMNFAHASAVARALPAYSVVTLPRGSISQAQDKPAADLQLLATQAVLVSRDDLHPALAYLLLDAAQKQHASGSPLQAAGQFPSPKVAEFTVADETVRYFKDGKPWLERVLPFWLANFIARLLLALIPVLAILFPLFKLWPSLQALWVARKLQPWYKQIQAIEHDYFSNTHANLRIKLDLLWQVEQGARATPVPTDFIKDRYALLHACELVRQRMTHTEIIRHAGDQPATQSPLL